MKVMLLAGGLMVALSLPAQAQMDCRQLVGGRERQMVGAIEAAVQVRGTENGPGHDRFCDRQFAVRDAVRDWLAAAQQCQAAMAGHASRVAQVRDIQQTITRTILLNCKLR